MNDTLHIRRGEPRDAETIAHFNLAMARETEDKPLDPEVARAGTEAVFDHPERGFYVVAERGNAVVGALMITREWSDWRNGHFWWIQSVYIRPQVRRQGIYRRLYTYVRDRAAAEPTVCGLRLYVASENHIAQRTYESLGMQQTHYQVYEDTF